LENVRGCFLPLHRLYLINAEPLSWSPVPRCLSHNNDK
jgi:hypothetical protein